MDDIFLVSPTGQPMYREPDLIDVWFDSGAMPYAQWHYPFEGEKHFKMLFRPILLLKALTKPAAGFIPCML